MIVEDIFSGKPQGGHTPPTTTTTTTTTTNDNLLRVKLRVIKYVYNLGLVTWYHFCVMVYCLLFFADQETN